MLFLGYSAYFRNMPLLATILTLLCFKIALLLWMAFSSTSVAVSSRCELYFLSYRSTGCTQFTGLLCGCLCALASSMAFFKSKSFSANNLFWIGTLKIPHTSQSLNASSRLLRKSQCSVNLQSSAKYYAIVSPSFWF